MSSSVISQVKSSIIITEMKRKISATMATQHPDHAQIPYWHTEAFISTQFEAQEALSAYSELGIGEYKWDWEGKLVDESILERLFSSNFEFFKNHPLGVDTFLTFRLPNPKVETEFRIGRAFMNLASGASIARHFDLPSPPIFEVILPMTQTAQEMLSIQLAYQQMHKLKHPLYRLENILTNLRIIPLFEDVNTIINSDRILEEYLKLYKLKFKKTPPYMRPYVARSDPALNSGIVPTVLAIKIALSRYRKLEKKLGIPLYPIIGAAVFPFRGGISPLRIEEFADEYKGIRTTTIQSAFRYDFNKKDVVKAILKLEELLPSQKAVEISLKEEAQIIELIPYFEAYYKEVIEEIAPIINNVSKLLPKRRERVQHIGLFGYSRGVGKVKLPRAIGFTGALYCLGIPPELIGTGRGLKKAKQFLGLEIVEKYYKYIKTDLIQAGKYLNRDNLERLNRKSKIWSKIKEDIKAIEDIFHITLGPITKEDKEHKLLTDKIYQNLENPKVISELILDAAIIRKSLG